jgi:hypothetical protein
MSDEPSAPTSARSTTERQPYTAPVLEPHPEYVQTTGASFSFEGDVLGIGGEE